ncbi:MAG: hypothetical protein ACIAZJ_17350 [Gimesia chilikensis]|uniref:hypothetical protein n=1 Tax=Gimesia chilikensis TaxID=2605989 RepID=UPI0037B92177
MTATIRYNRNGLFDRLIANRTLLTWVTMLSLTGAYLVYAQVLRQVINGTVVRQEFPEEVFQSPEYASANNEHAKTYLPEIPWAADARYQFKDENVFIYTERWQQEEEKRAARLKPFAMLMFDPKKKDSEKPFALMSEKALIRFEQPFGIKQTDPGRMIAGSLEGYVKITGPNGLIVYGRNFFYDEASMNIFSASDVRFAYEGHRGRARGIEMKLIPAPNKPKELKPAVEGIREIILRHDVYMELDLKKDEQADLKNRTRFAQVKSAGSFTFNLETSQGTFSNNVRVYRPTGPQQGDRLDCDQLQLQFVRKEDPDNPTAEADKKPGHASGKLQFQELVATGQNVTLISQENEFFGRMTRLSYNEVTKTTVLTDERSVKIDRQASILECPKITIHQDEEGRVETVLCEGAGKVDYVDPGTGQLTVAARWAKLMKKSRDPATQLEMIELEQQCEVRQPAEEFALAAQQIRLWLKGDLGALKQKDMLQKDRQENAKKTAQKVDPHKMIATQDVAIYSPQLRGKTKRLEVWFDEATVPASAPNAPVSKSVAPQKSAIQPAAFAVDDTPAGQQGGRTPLGPEKKEPEPVMVVSDLIKLRMQKDEAGKAEVSEVWTEGNVSVKQLNETQKQPMHITGNQMHIQNKGENDQVLHVMGTPAKINGGESQIEGDDIFLYRLANRAEVQGKGLLLLPVKGGKKSAAGLLSGAEGITQERGLTGEVLEQGNDQENLLEIHWDQEMVFDGITANFFGKVRTNMGDNRLRCQEMEVILSDRVSFTEKQPEGQKPTVHFITCRDGVEVESNEYQDNRLIGIRRASFWQMNVDQKTGNAEARGPGWLILWRRENSKESNPESRVSQANLPQKTDTDSWNYTRIDFNGKMSGNVSQRSTTFDDRVQITYGGVKRPLDTINPDQLPPNAGWMRSNSLKLIQHDIEGQKKKFISMLAKGNAELEGNALVKNKKTPTNQSFIARADTISYDESKDLYMMRSFGNRKATIRRYSRTGKTPSAPNQAQQIEFAPSYDRVTLHGVTGLQGLP